jgi:hypothetical protein
LAAVDTVEVGRAVARLDAWFDTMRAPDGYGGPISHWWESSLLYCGPMADWRYEGLIGGYVELHRATRAARWLERAVRAGDDLLRAQTPTGNFRASAFQQGPMEGGTPHEAAVDVGLFDLAARLRDTGDDRWHAYFAAGARNVERYLIGQLWDGHGFRDQPWNEVMVANKNATTIEALVLFEALSGRDMTRYLDGAAEIIRLAVEPTGPRAGSTVHGGTGRHRLAVGIYTARSMCALLRLHERRPDDRLLELVGNAIGFLVGLIDADGCHFGRYRDGRPIASPRLVAGSGDVLRLLAWAARYGLSQPGDVARLTAILVQAQTGSGSLPTAIGMDSRGSSRRHVGRPDLRDVLPVVGWCDKAFRALCLVAADAPIEADPVPVGRTDVDCAWHGRPGMFSEDATRLQLVDGRSGRLIYRWWKGTCYPDIYRL